MEAGIDAICEGLERLRRAKRPADVFGAETHEFRLNPPLSEAEVCRFEAAHGIRLPEEYRRFLIRLGNGGAGPFYGIFKLGEMDDADGFQRWREGDGFVGVLARPFPHSEPWNDRTGAPEEIEDEVAYEAALDAFDARYFDPDLVNGAIPICHEGCALRDWLVVTGAEAGHVWHDARTDGGGLWPVTKRDKGRVTFLEWYLDWLSRALETPPPKQTAGSWQAFKDRLTLFSDDFMKRRDQSPSQEREYGLEEG